MEPARHILIAVDLSDRSDHIIREGLRLATAPGDEVILVHVVHDLESMLGVYVCDKPLPELQAELEIEGKSKLRRLHQEHFGNGGPVAREILLTGAPWSEIVGCALRHRADLVVMGAHAEGKPEHRVLGSTIGRVLRHSPCAVVVVPAE